MSTLVEIRSLCHRWPGGRQVLHDVNLILGEGERIALVGAHGAGKSTLLLQIVGLLNPAYSPALEGPILA